MWLLFIKTQGNAGIKLTFKSSFHGGTFLL